MQLPSGREVEVRPPTYGDILDAEDAQHIAGPGLNTAYRFLVSRLTGLTPAEINGLSVADGRVLTLEVKRVLEGRPATAEAPFESNSSPASEATPA